MVRNMELPQILQLGFKDYDSIKIGNQFRKNYDIKSWVMGYEAPQLRDYVKSDTVQQLIKKDKLLLRAHLVIIVGSRHILLWDMNEKGELAHEPRLVETPRRLKRKGG